jgi:hypothetical protein
MIIPTRPQLPEAGQREEVSKSLLDMARQINEADMERKRLLLADTTRFGVEPNVTEFQDDGFLKSFGKARQYKDIILPASNLRPGPSSPSYVPFLGNIYAARFDNGVTDEVYGTFELQHDYYEGSEMYLHIHWSPDTAGTGNLVWGVEYTFAALGQVFPAPTVVTVPWPAPGVLNQHVAHDIAVIPGFGLQIGAQCAFRLYRLGGDVADTYAGNCFLHTVGVHYAADTLGSRGIFTKE